MTFSSTDQFQTRSEDKSQYNKPSILRPIWRLSQCAIYFFTRGFLRMHQLHWEREIDSRPVLCGEGSESSQEAVASLKYKVLSPCQDPFLLWVGKI